jgi:glycosyltransferase involved in cell wall biosynthesis
MEPYKGHRILIDALAQLSAETPWQCWIVGGAQRPSETAYESQLKDAVVRTGLGGQIHFLGTRSDVSAVLAAADLFCHPNQSAEPFGLAIVEAMRAGLPVVASALGGPGEIVTAECGRLVAAADPRALALALRGLIDDAPLRSALGDCGPIRARALCDPKARLAELDRALEGLTTRAVA